MNETSVVQQISDWLIARGLQSGTYEDVLSGFCERLDAGGFGLRRSMLAMRTLHPTIDARSLIWRRAAPLEPENFMSDAGPTEDFLRSPIAHLLENEELYELHRPIHDPSCPFDFPVLQDLKEEGVTDYMIMKVAFPVASLKGYQSGMLISSSCDAPGGFTENQIAALRRLAPRFALVISNLLLHEVTINVLDTYVGQQAGERILSGEIQRGSLREIDAVILYMDLRGFTALADRTHGARMARLLNGYFERIVPEITGRGGEILKFLGDGILATFSLSVVRTIGLTEHLS